MATKVSVPVMMSAEQEEALTAYATDNGNVSRSEVARKAIAAYIGYDLEGEAPTARRTKYATPAEREKARKDAAKKRRDDQKALAEAVKAFQLTHDIAALAASLSPDMAAAALAPTDVEAGE